MTYRIDGSVDRILEQLPLQADSVINQLEAINEKDHLNLYKTWIDNKQLHNIAALCLQSIEPALSLIAQHINRRAPEEKKVAVHLLAVIVDNLEHSSDVWKQLVRIMERDDENKAIAHLNRVLRIEALSTRLIEILQICLDAVALVNGDFFLAPQKAIHKARMKDFDLQQVIIVINHLMKLPELSYTIASMVFDENTLGAQLVLFIKQCIRNLNL